MQSSPDSNESRQCDLVRLVSSLLNSQIGSGPSDGAVLAGGTWSDRLRDGTSVVVTKTKVSLVNAHEC